MGLRDLGEQRLKDIDRPEHVYQLVADGLRVGVPAAADRGRTQPAAAGSRSAPPRVVAAVVAAAAAAVILGTRGGSSPRPRAAAAVSADSVGIFDSANGRLTGPGRGRRLAERGRRRRRLDLGRRTSTRTASPASTRSSRS